MCALICALNRSRKGCLPHGRMELYRAALELLLVRRDRERDVVVGGDGPELEHDQQVALLQKVAYWLIRNGRSEIEWHKAVEILERALPAMPHVAQRGSAEDILRHLVLRSGLLRQPTSGTLDFIHRTFQDYLGAQAAVDEWDFDVLVNNAHDDQWEDVLRMAVGHAPPRARAELLGMLLERGDREEGHRHRLHLLAAACLEHAVMVDPEIRARVEKSAAELVPPRDVEAAKALAGGGAGGPGPAAGAGGAVGRGGPCGGRRGDDGLGRPCHPAAGAVRGAPLAGGTGPAGVGVGPVRHGALCRGRDRQALVRGRAGVRGQEPSTRGGAGEARRPSRRCGSGDRRPDDGTDPVPVSRHPRDTSRHTPRSSSATPIAVTGESPRKRAARPCR
ncbi:hypothetical protein GCM10020000_45780 [Streptomyces olivoverticillatus]